MNKLKKKSSIIEILMLIGTENNRNENTWQIFTGSCESSMYFAS